ncbi:MAG: hypothetical protein M3O35_16290 [Acidobacteriota bacterium]|jgi:hypothetical protein|nr:hypothetical protein [Acidobacteriota bacterium]
MKTNFGRLLMAIGFSAVLGSSLMVAQPKPTGKADIPFGFYVHNTVLPAGSYTVQETGTSGVVQIRNNSTGESILTMAPPDRSGRSENSKLVFHKYGERYFLSELWLTGSAGVDCVSMGKLEREISKSPAALATVAMR